MASNGIYGTYGSFELDQRETFRQPQPCPFCGGVGLRWTCAEASPSAPVMVPDGSLGIINPGTGYFQVQCNDCGARGPFVHATRSAACPDSIGAWNKRALFGGGC